MTKGKALSKSAQRWAIGGLILFAAFCAYLVLQAYLQGSSVKAAFQHGEKLQSIISNDNRYAELTIYGQSAPGRGMIFIRGVVNSEEDLAELKGIVTQTAPPVEVMSWVQIVDSTVVSEPPENGDWTWHNDPDSKWNQQLFKGKVARVPTTE